MSAGPDLETVIATVNVRSVVAIGLAVVTVNTVSAVVRETVTVKGTVTMSLSAPHTGQIVTATVTVRGIVTVTVKGNTAAVAAAGIEQVRITTGMG